MSVAAFIGLRYLRAKKNNRYLSLITFLSVAGVAIGVAALIIILSVMDGFEGALKSRLSQGEFHILVSPDANMEEPYFAFSTEQTAKLFASHPLIEAVNPVLTTEAILKARRRVTGLSLRGISDPQIASIAKQVVEALDGPRVMSIDGIWLGKELAYQMNLAPGDSVQIISPLETVGPLESVPRVRTFKVEGIFDSGIPEKDLHVAYAPVDAVRSFLQKPAMVNQVEIQVSDFARSSEAAAAVRQVLRGNSLVVKDWEQLNAHLFASLKLERITMFVILTIIILVASFNIVTSLKMLVIEKRKEIAILRAMGARTQQIRNIFFIQGAIISVIGSLSGAMLGVGISLSLKKMPFELPDIFYDRSIPVNLSPLFVVLVVAVAIMIVLIATLFPAQSAVKMTPIEGIRNG